MTRIQAVVEDSLGDGALSIQEAADRHYGPGFRQRTNGKWADRADVLNAPRALRASTSQARVTVLDELADAPRYAERHVIELRTTDGKRIAQEVYVFSRLDDDRRLSRIKELTRPLPDHGAGD
jgi:hypothetical protein